VVCSWHTDAEAAAREAVTLSGRYNVYAGVNPRTSGGGKKEHTTAIISLHAELDDAKFPGGRLGILAALETLPPTLLIDSGGGVHARWDLAVPLRLDGTPAARAATIARVENLMRRIYRFLGGDADPVQDVSRILRIPGTLNHKPEYGTPRPVSLIAHTPERRYDLDALDALLPALPVTPRTTPPVHRGHPPVSTDDRAVLDHARAAKNGAKFARLHDAGDTSGYASHSEARQALCSLLAFWCEHDQAQCARLFETSALYREDKWPRERDRVLEIAYSRGDFYRWPAPAARVPLSILDTPPIADDGVDYLAMPHDALARLAAELAAVAAERGRRLDAIDTLLLCAEMSETEKVTAYAVVKTAAVAQERQPDAAPTHKIVVNQKAIAGDIGLSRQTIGKKLQIWSGQGYMGKETRGTGRFTKEGREIKETVLSLPGRSLTDNLAMASTWHRPPDAKRHGGNGNRCPQCASTEIKTTIETKTVKTTTRSCASCGHVHKQNSRTVGKPTTTYSFSDDTTPPMLDLAAMRGHTVSILDTPPIPPAPDRDRARRTPRVSILDTPPVATLPPRTCGTPDKFATPPPAGTLSGVDSPPAPPVASWDGTHPCGDCGATCYAPAGTVPRCLPCTRGRPADHWGDVAAGDD
jgi:Zn ribbon nucleic-acid-binding protein